MALRRKRPFAVDGTGPRFFAAFLNAQLGQGFHDVHGCQADGNDLTDKAHDVLRIVGAIGIVDDAAALVGRDLILVDDPLQRRAVAEAVFVSLGRDAAQGEEVVVAERSLVLAEAHLLDAPVQLPLLDVLQWIFDLLFVVDVELGETAAGVDESPEHLLVVIGSHPVTKGGRQGWGTPSKDSRRKAGPPAGYHTADLKHRRQSFCM